MGAPDGVVMPSTLSYRDRLELARSDGYTYAQLYSTSRQSDVFGRLTSDALGRQLRSSQGERGPGQDLPWLAAREAFQSKGTLSGFITNSGKAVYTHGTFRVGHQSFNDKSEVALRPQQLTRFRKREPYDFFAQIRPDTETMSQSLRMYGTYEPDRAAAKQVGAFIPNCCPGGAPFYHPDVRLTGAAAGPGTHADYYTRRAQTVLGTNRGGLPQ